MNRRSCELVMNRRLTEIPAGILCGLPQTTCLIPTYTYGGWPKKRSELFTNISERIQYSEFWTPDILMSQHIVNHVQNMVQTTVSERNFSNFKESSKHVNLSYLFFFAASWPIDGHRILGRAVPILQLRAHGRQIVSLWRCKNK